MSKVETVATIMAKNLITLRPTDDIYKAMEVFDTKKISGAPVVDGSGNIVGVLSEKDCMRVLVESVYSQAYGGIVADYMSKAVSAISVDTPILRVAELFLSQPFRRFPVVDDAGVLVGQVSRRDVVQHMLRTPVDGRMRQTDVMMQTGRLARGPEEMVPEAVGPTTNQRF